MLEIAAVWMDEQKAIVAVIITTVIVQTHLRLEEKCNGFSKSCRVI